MKKRAGKLSFFLMLVLILASTYLSFFGISTTYGDVTTTWIKGADDIRWGIDIRGGVDVTRLPEFKRAAYLGRVFQDPALGAAGLVLWMAANLALDTALSAAGLPRSSSPPASISAVAGCSTLRDASTLRSWQLQASPPTRSKISGWMWAGRRSPRIATARPKHNSK